MSDIRVNVYDSVKQGDAEETRRRIAQWRAQARKLPTSAWSRMARVDDAQRESVDELVYGLDTLEEYVVMGRFGEAKALARYVEKVYRNCCDEFRERD